MIELELNKIIEALLFVSEKPLTIKQITEVCPKASNLDIKNALKELKDIYSAPERGVQIIEVAGGYQFCSHPDCEPYLSKLYKTKKVFRLSGPALETLAIISYKQPVTKSEMEFIRGVNVDGVIKSLEDRELIKIKGRKEVAGRPILYGTSDKFLHYFGLKCLQDLPSLEEFAATALEKEAQIKQEQDEEDEQNLQNPDPKSEEKADSDLSDNISDQESEASNVEENNEINAQTEENNVSNFEEETTEDIQEDDKDIKTGLAENIDNNLKSEDDKKTPEQMQTQIGDACDEQDEHREITKSN